MEGIKLVPVVATILCLFLCLGATAASSLQNYDRDHMHPRSEPNQRQIIVNDQDVSPEVWTKNARDALTKRLQQKRMETVAKNTIFFLGDGMGVATVSAARIFKGQLEGGFGEKSSLFFESFPNVAASKTFCTDKQVADSACSATAYLSGIKTNYNMINIKPNVMFGDCVGQMNVSNHVESALAWAQAAGKSTGVVTTTRITHASPAGTYAHAADRDWENDDMVSKSGQDKDICDDIAEQLVLREPGSKINVILGGGRREFLSDKHLDPETNKPGLRRDGKDLIQDWITAKKDLKANYVWNKTEFEKIKPDETDYLLGLFNENHMDYTLDNDNDPTLAELTKKAIEILSKNPKGFFLFVEGGRIDHAHHDTRAQKALVETISMDDAVKAATEMTSEDDTLVLVTADHSHVMTIAGYQERNNPILHIADNSDIDHLPYTTLSYANGPGYRPPVNNERHNISDHKFDDKDYQQITTLPVDSETHGGEDVLVYARGPFSHLLTGVVQQSYIPHVIGYASCTGSGPTYCADRDEDNAGSISSPAYFSILIFLLASVFKLV